MSENDSEPEETGISDDQLPDDLVASEDNPLAESLEDGDTVDDLMEGGKTAEQDSGPDSGSDSGSDSED